MRAADVMVTNVISVAPEDSVVDVAKTLLRNRISGVPVVAADGSLVGIVSEGDLLRRVETGTERHRSWWLEIFMRSDALAAEYVKAHARKVSDVMTRQVVTAQEDTPLAEIADLIERHRIKRLPIMRDGRLVGIVTRANLIQGLATTRQPDAPSMADDRTIRDAVLAKMRAAPWGIPTGFNVTVRDGVVDLWGFVLTTEEKDAVRIAAETTPGVAAVHDNLRLQPIAAGM